MVIHLAARNFYLLLKGYLQEDCQNGEDGGSPRREGNQNETTSYHILYATMFCQDLCKHTSSLLAWTEDHTLT